MLSIILKINFVNYSHNVNSITCDAQNKDNKLTEKFTLIFLSF